MTNAKKIHASNLITISPTITSALRLITYSSLKLRQLINSSNHGKLQPGAISTIRKLCINRRKYKFDHKKDHKPTKQTGINYSNLHTIKLMENQDWENIKTIRIVSINMCSIKNKDLLLSEQLDNLNIDLAVLTETWLKDTPEDKAWLNQ